MLSLSPGLVTSETTTLNPELSEERKKLRVTLPILDLEDVAEAVGYLLSTSENVQVLGVNFHIVF